MLTTKLISPLLVSGVGRSSIGSGHSFRSLNPAQRFARRPQGSAHIPHPPPFAPHVSPLSTVPFLADPSPFAAAPARASARDRLDCSRPSGRLSRPVRLALLDARPLGPRLWRFSARSGSPVPHLRGGSLQTLLHHPSLAAPGRWANALASLPWVSPSQFACFASKSERSNSLDCSCASPNVCCGEREGTIGTP